MSDFPEKIWLDKMDIYLGVGGKEAKNHYIEGVHYIRSDLVTQWQPIETLTTNERVIVLFDNDHIDSGWLDNVDERRFFRTGHGKLPLTRLTHWMQIPKVTE
jgi:hypothetical protein